MEAASCHIVQKGYPVIFITALDALVFAMLGCPVLTVIFLVLVLPQLLP